MTSFVLLTDSSCDLPASLVSEHNLQVVPLLVTIDGQSYHQYPDDRELPPQQVYDRLRDKAVVTTSAANVFDFEQAMESCLKDGQDVLYIGLSSALSGTFGAACAAAEELAAQYPDRAILTVDSLNGSLGLGLLLMMVNSERQRGCTVQEAAAFAIDTRLRLVQWFTVDSLFFLKRGGRLSAATAAVGTLLHIKPVFHVNDRGELEPVEKVRGRTASLRALVDHTLAQAQRLDAPILVAHGDCAEEAQQIAALLRTGGATDVRVLPLGPVIGAHSGPGTLAVSCVGTKR